MNERFNKPKIFLSHSKKDAELIRQLYRDLQQCQIEPRIDEIENRHEKPWLDAVFEEGIPTCDCVFVYLTEHSVNSALVKQELDAAALGQLHDSKVALLPYVSTAKVRAGLRADLRGLQIPVLDMENYPQILPKLVAEVWRSFLERTIATAVQRERVKRLEAELELERICKESSSGVFTETEEREFLYIAAQLNRDELVQFTETRKNDEKNRPSLRTIRFKISVLSLLSEITGSEYHEYSDSSVTITIKKNLINVLQYKIVDNRTISISRPYTKKSLFLADELLRYGFIKRIESSKSVVGYNLAYTERLERFKHWLAFNGKLSDKLIWSLVDVKEINSQDSDTQ